MALWQQFNSIGAPPGIQDNFHSVYFLPRDELIICLRVVFANWIEVSIGKISPAAFVGALEFQIASSLRKKRTLPVEHTNLRHPSKLSSYQRLLQKYKTPDAIDKLYRKFVHCLYEECKVIKLHKMENFIPTELYELIESLQKDFEIVDGQVRYADLCMQMQTISNESCRFPTLHEELRNLINELGTSFARFDRSHQDFEAHQFILGPQENEPHFNLLIIVSKELLDQAQQILGNKAKIEHKLREIRNIASSFIGDLQHYLHCNEKLHAFRNRSVKRNVEELGTQAEKALLFLKEIWSMAAYVVDANRYDYLKVLNISHGVMMTLLTIRAAARNERAELRNRDSYNITEISRIMQELENLQWSIYQNFTLVMESQPPSVIIKGSPRPIAVRLFKLDSISTSNLPVKVQVYLVNEKTVKDIRTGLNIPERIYKITPQCRNRDSIAGSIVITDYSQSSNRAPTSTSTRGRGRRRPVNQTRRSSEDSIDSLPSSAVVELMHENNQNLKSCYFDKVLLVKTINRSSKTVRPCVGTRRKPSQNRPSANQSRSSENVTNDKVALLFVTEIPFKNEIRKVWTISLPMIVAAHGSQNEKAYATMAWDEVMYTPTRKGFEVDDTANWSQVSEMIKGAFENLVGEPLKPHHLLYLKGKLEQYIGISLNNYTPISKNVLCEVSAHSFWLWFYRSISIIKTSSHFHHAWKLGFIEGFINYDHATMILLNNSPRVKPGTLIVRFSDTVPGSLTIVFMGFVIMFGFLRTDRKIYKMQPMDLFKKTAMQDCATILLGQLNVKENVHKKEIFSYVYPNIAKEVAFDKFYKWAAKQTTQTFQGYVVMSLFVPLASPTLPIDSSGDDSSASPTRNNDSNSVNMTDCSSVTGTSQQPDQFVGYNISPSFQAPFPVTHEMESADDFYMNIQPSEIRNYSIIA